MSCDILSVSFIIKLKIESTITNQIHNINFNYNFCHENHQLAETEKKNVYTQKMFSPAIELRFKLYKRKFFKYHTGVIAATPRKHVILK